MKEEEIIQLFYKSGQIPVDDCDYDEKHRQLISTDSLAEGTHFSLDWSSPEDIAIKLLEVNVSDILSSGGIPHSIYLNLGLNSRTSEKSWIEKFSHELKAGLANYNLRLAGGDTFRSQTTVLSITILGDLHPNLPCPWSRSQGQISDSIYITGTVGLSTLGLSILQGKNFPQSLPHDLAETAISKHLRPRSKFGIMELLTPLGIHSCMDITDGLIQDMERLADACGKSFHIQADSLPKWKELRKFLTPEEILGSGEELELVFLAKGELPKIIGNFSLTKIGTVESRSKEVCVFTENGERLSLKEAGFLHF
ncbi:MAG: thiamine-phosphate kinase [Leptospira sp.]|nr:thiamine-phosphate kinase [Leptospira sp.]